MSTQSTIDAGPRVGTEHDGFRVRWTAHGAASSVALAELVAGEQAGDPLAPVTVVTPSPAVAVALRRDLARRGGLAGVTFADLGAVAEQLAVRHDPGALAGADAEVVAAAVRVELAERPGHFAPISSHRSTWEAVAGAVAELAALDAAGRARVGASGALARDLVRVHDAVVARIAVGGRARVVRAATEAVGAGVVLDEVGAVVVHLPDPPPPGEVRLLRALAGRARVHLVLGATGTAADDRLAEAFGVAGPADPAAPAAPTAVYTANDVDDEVRNAVRRLLAFAEAGVPWDSMALVHPAGAPYGGIVADVLRAAGVPFSGPSTRTLGHTAAGRVVDALLAVVGSGLERQAVVDLWSTGVVVDVDGAPVPAAAFDRASRRMGIVGRGADQWRSAAGREIERLQARLDDARAADPGGDHARTESRLAAATAMRDEFERLAALVDTVPDTWPDVAGWVADALDVLCGPVATRVAWPDRELDADDAIRTALRRLGALGAVEATPATGVVPSTIRRLLEAPAPRGERLGHGVLVTTIDRPPVVPLRAVAVVGLSEGFAPVPARDDVLLGDDVRAGAGLPVRAGRDLVQRRGFEAALASASDHRILSAARNDQRSGRALVPSRWLVDAVERLTGTRPEAEALLRGAATPGVEVVASFEASLHAVRSGAGPVRPLHGDERVVAELAGVDDLATHPVAAEGALARGLDLLDSRRARAFTRFDGNLDGGGVDLTGGAVLSPTALEDYAGCPRRYFFGKVLRLRDDERPEELERIEPRERGSLVHRVLERFFGENIDAGTVPGPGQAWDPAAVERALAITAEECEAVERRGITGHPRRWEHDRAEIENVIRHTLDVDADIRAQLGVTPVAVEFTFGRDGEPPVEVTLPDGRVLPLAGQADRLDEGAGVVAVWDYKHASPSGYDVINRDEARGGDRLGHGRRLQLVAYALAAAGRAAGGAVVASYWFVMPGTEGCTAGYRVDDELRDRFAHTLQVIADGVEGGRFPPRPGPLEWRSWGEAHEMCRYCDYSSICPADRAEEWERVRFHPSLRRLDTLTTEGSTAIAPVTEEGR